MGNKRQAQLRERASINQGGTCHYCGLPMCFGSPDAFRKRHNVRPGAMPWVGATAEHLVARCEGGPTTATNIVAVHHYCNVIRHRRRKPQPPGAYQARVRRAVAAGRWPICQMLRSARPAT